MLQSIKKLTQKNRSSQKLSQPNLSKSCLRILKWKHQFKMLTHKTRNHLQKSVMMERTAKAWAPEKGQLKWVCKKWKNKLAPKNQTFQNQSWNQKSNQRLKRRKSRKHSASRKTQHPVEWVVFFCGAPDHKRPSPEHPISRKPRYNGFWGRTGPLNSGRAVI